MIRSYAFVLILLATKLAFAQEVSPAPRMNLRDFSEYHLYVDLNGDGEIDDSEDQRSEEAKQRMATLKQGVRVMKARKPSDPTSWFYQAAVHGVTNEAVAAAADRDPGVFQVQRQLFWNQCPHGGQPSADFLVWHRAYLYFFERILREASGDPTLSLPYWDYTGGSVRFPREFSDPEIAAGDFLPRNPLYNPGRDLAFTAGRTTLSQEVTTGALQLLERETLFFGPTEDTGFAGGVYDENPRTMGRIERRPHNDLHVAIGGLIGPDLTGDMTQVQTAAFDPIFWVHHANIDRIYSYWVRLPNRSWGHFPDASWFVDRPWYFNDVDGSIQNHQRAFYLDDKKLVLKYDDVDFEADSLIDELPYSIPDANLFLATLPQNMQIDPQTGKFTAQMAPTCECCRVKSTQVELSAATATEIKLNAVGDIEASRQLLVAAPRMKRPVRKPQTILKISFLPPSSVPGVGYDVLVGDANLGEDKMVSIGALSVFGANHHSEHGSDSSTTLTQNFNISEAIQKTQIELKNLRVIVKPYPLFKDGVEPTSRVRSGGMTVTNVDVKIE